MSRQPPSTKLTPEAVASMRAEYRPGVSGYGAGSLAKKHGVALSTAQAVLNGTHWRDQ